MLVLSRRKGERIFLGPDVVVTITDVGHKTVRLGIDAPRDVAIVREEVAYRDAATVNRVATSPVPRGERVVAPSTPVNPSVTTSHISRPVCSLTTLPEKARNAIHRAIAVQGITSSPSELRRVVDAVCECSEILDLIENGVDPDDI